MVRHSSFIAICVISVSRLGFAQAVPPAQQSYTGQVLPVLEQFCFDCHADGTRKGKFALDEHQDFAALRADLKHWDHVRQMVVTHVMPPAGKKAPTLDQRDALVRWIDDNIFSWPEDQPDPGHVVIRRLNRAQYNNTIRDVLHIYDFQPADEFPPDDTGYGYDNIGAVLSVSPMLMEKYLRAARKIAEAVTRVRPPEKASLTLKASRFDRRGPGLNFEDDGVLWFQGNVASTVRFDAPADGLYRIVLSLAATEVENHKARVHVALDGRSLEEHDVTGIWRPRQNTTWQELELEAGMTRGGHSLQIAFINDFKDASLPENHRDLDLAVKEAEIDGPIGLTAPRPSRFMQEIAPGVNFGPPSLDLSGEDFLPGEGTSARDTGAVYLASSGWVHYPLQIAKGGIHKCRLKAGALQAGTELARWEVRLGDRVLHGGSVTRKDQTPEWFEFEADIPAGRHDLRVAFLNDYYDPATKADRNLWVHQFRIEGADASGAPLAASDLPGMIAHTGSLLFRRDMTEAEKAKWTDIARKAIDAGEPPAGAFGFALEGMLASPAFLFHSQPRPAGSKIGDTELIDQVTLAARLSYFLWSAPPDQTLSQLAAKGALRDNLGSQIKRMIGDSKARAFTDNFAGQWLLLRDADLITPSKRAFPDFQSGLASDMKRETETFFDYILHENRSVIDFLNADYTFVNRRLAKYYQLPDADRIKTSDKNSYARVSLAGTPRGGLLTQGSILAITSNPTRTNIVRRGKFILENLLGMPPPPAPGDVPPLDEQKVRFGHLTLRQQFEQHRSNASCAGCHALLDPIGFAMENYDAVGRYRETDNGQPVDATGVLIRGQKFTNLIELRQTLAQDMKGDFVRCLAENLLTFALGRGLEYTDRPAVRQIVKQAEKSDYRFQDLILAICESVPFQRMRTGSLAAQ